MPIPRYEPPPPRWLWLTLAVPDPPTNGQFLYSKGLIQAAASAGVSLDIVALGRPDAPQHNPGGSHRWWIADDRPRSRWASLVSPLPHMANIANTRAMRRLLSDRLTVADAFPGDAGWDAIVLDSLAAGWARRHVLAAIDRLGRRPALIYLAHNHEGSVARRVAAIHPHPLKRQINRVDALKVDWLERSLAADADVITANSPEDCALFRRDYPDKPVRCLRPVFLGAHVMARRIGPGVPRRAVMLGTYDWLPKRRNLVEFLRVADPLFAAAGVELQVVGGAKPAFLEQLRRTVRATTFTGPIDDPSPYLAAARIGLVAERVGGGFKLKTLDYVFNRVPVAALAGTMPGMPLRDADDAVICPDFEALARRVIDVIDDFTVLNRMQARAYQACRSVFDLAAGGRSLLSAVSGTASDAAAAPPLLATA